TETLELLCRLVESMQLSQKIQALLRGNKINLSEKRAALHTGLRSYRSPTLMLDGKNILDAVRQTLNKMAAFTENIHNQSWLGSTQKPIRDIVNVGMGGSHLGPLMVTHALSRFAQKDLTCHFISNIDSAHIQEVL